MLKTEIWFGFAFQKLNCPKIWYLFGRFSIIPKLHAIHYSNKSERSSFACSKCAGKEHFKTRL